MSKKSTASAATKGGSDHAKAPINARLSRDEKIEGLPLAETDEIAMALTLAVGFLLVGLREGFRRA